MTEVKNLKIPSGCSAFGWWSFKHDGGSICDINNDDCVSYKSFDSCHLVEIYTKADIVAMLKELKEQLREMHEDFFETEHFDEAYGVSDSMDIIQQKIDKLKENT